MKTMLITKRGFIIIGAIAAAFIISVISIKTNSAEVASEPRKLPIYSVNTEKKQIALTLDCAWENSDTSGLLSIFEENNIKATFFVTGDFCKRYGDDIKLISQKGHGVENHSYNHPHVAAISREKLIDDTTKCDEIIKELTGKLPTLYRAPYGEYSNNMLSVFETELSHKVIQWDVDSRDWQGKSSADMVTSVTKNVKSGSIILFHNDTKNTPNALKQIIPQLKGEGYEFVLVEDLIYKEDYSLDHEGRQVKIKD